MPSEVPIRCMAAFTEDAEQEGGLVPLFVGRDDGTVQRFDAMQDAALGIASVVFYAHRRPVTGIVATAAAELHTCSLDGTMKQWTLGEAPAEAVRGGGARVRASLVKTTTFPFGVSVMVRQSGNRLLLGGEDGSLTLMEGERRSTWRAHDGGAVTAIGAKADGGNAVLTGGADGVVYVWDMEFGRPVCELRGHDGPLRGLALVPVPPTVPIVRQRRSTADADAVVTEALVYGGGDDGDSATCVVSCAADGTVRVWLLPDLREANAEAERLERRQQQQQLQEHLEHAVGAPRRSIGISFQEPTVTVAATDENASPKEGSVHSSPAGNEEGHNEADAASATNDAEDEGSTEPATAEASRMELDAKEQFLRQQLNAAAFKSAIKAPERRIVPQQTALGMVELPQTPFSCAAPSSSSVSGDGGDGEGPASLSLLFIGAAHGDVYGLRTHRLVKDVCLHTAQNFQKVQQEVAQVQKTLKDATRVYAKAAAAKIKAEASAQLAVAAKARRAKLAEERAARQRAAEERRAARRKAAEDEEGEEEEENEEEGEEEEGDEEAENPFSTAEDDDEEREDEEKSEEAEASSTDPQQPHRPASWAALSLEQRAALEAFCAAQEAERDRRIAALQASVDAHVAQVRPLAKTVYHRSRAQFSNLAYTTEGRLHGGTAVTAMAAASLVADYADKVYAAQANAVVPVTVAIGLTKL